MTKDQYFNLLIAKYEYWIALLDAEGSKESASLLPFIREQLEVEKRNRKIGYVQLAYRSLIDDLENNQDT